MATTPNLLLELIEQSQSQKEVTANEAFSALDTAVAGRLSLAIVSATTTLTAAQALHAILELTGTLTANSVVNVPARPKLYIVRNATSGAFTLTVKTPSGSGIVVAAGTRRLLYCDGTNVVAVDDASAGAQPFDASVYAPGKPVASQILLRVPIARTVTFASGWTSSQAVARVAATASTVVDIRRNGASIGSITWSAAATVATFSGAGATFSAGDILSLHAPATPDATLEDVGVTLVGTR